MKSVSIIILNWKKPDLTIDCLRSIEKIKVDGFKLKTYIVDNNSDDGSVEKISAFIKNRLDCEVLVNDDNLGFAEGNNEGIRYCLDKKADYLVLLNNDTVVDKNLISGLLETSYENPDAALISPKIYFAKGFEFHKNRYSKSELGKVIWYAGGIIDWNNIYGSNFGVDEVDKGQFEKVQITDFATGACVLCKSEALKKIGLFDKKYYMYLEDMDLSQRAKKEGYRVLYTPKGLLWHKVSQSSVIGGNLNDYFITRNRLLFGFRYASARTKFALYRESVKLLLGGREWQKKGALDFYVGRFGKGRWGS